MKRYTPITRRTPLRRSQKPMPKRSKSPVRAERLRLYAVAKAEAKTDLKRRQEIDPAMDYVLCEWPGCNEFGTDPHHTHGRRGPNLYDKTKLRFLCRAHHIQVHHDPKAARGMGLIA